MNLGWIPLTLAIIAAIAAVLIGLMVWFGEQANRVRVPFLWLAVFVALWITSNVIFVLVPEEYRFVIALASYAAALFVAVQTLLFSLQLIRYKLTNWIKIGLGFGYGAAVASAAPGVVGYGVEGTKILTAGPGITIYAALVVIYLLTACISLIVYRTRAARVVRRQIKLVMYGVVIASLIGLTFNLVLPMFGNYSLVQIGPAGATVFIALVAYAVARYNLFDVRLAIVRGVAYLATIATIVAVYFVIAYIVAVALNGALTTPDQMIVNIFTALVIALLLQPIKRFFDKLTDKYFYRDNYDTGDFFAELNKVLGSTHDLRALLKRASATVASSLRADHASFFIYGQARAISAGTAGHPRMAVKDGRTLDDFAEDHNMAIIQTGLLAAQDPIRRLLTGYHAAIALPLVQQDRIIGYLLLGERRSAEYTRRDLRLLSSVADELVIAIENALAVQEVRELNETLQQRIDIATQELRQSNAQLQRLDETKDEFISMASHQLRTPLTSIKGYISMVVEGDAGKVTTAQKRFLDEAFLSSERMVRLINEFLSVSRLQTGKFTIDKRETDLTKLVHQEIDSLMPSATSRNLKFKFTAGKNIPLMNIDEGKMRQVVMNLADNAIYYSKEKATITIKLEQQKDKIVFTVQDRGIGVPADEQSELFGKFFRATNARLQRPDGTGIGLFLTKKVIDAHGGTLLFESKEGKGSTFGFTLPVK